MALFDGLKNLLKADTTDEERQDLGLEDLDGWLGEREAAARRRLEEETQGPRADIRAAIHDLDTAVKTLAEEGHQDVPARVEAILRTAIPAFVTAMDRALAREIPDDDPEAFYAAASSMLTDVIRATRTRGKYLSAAHPETARSIRTTTQQFGDAINAMTGALHRSREQIAAVEECREAAGALERIRREYDTTRESMAEHETRLHTLNDALQSVEEEKERLASGPEVRESADREEKLRNARRRLEEVQDRYRRTQKTAAGLIRRAAKVAGGRGDEGAAASCRRALAVLEGEGGIRDLREVLPAAEESVHAMIDADALRIKNKEETALVRERGAVLSRVEMLSSRIEAERTACTSADEEWGASTGRHLLREVAERESRLTREKDDILQALVAEERHLERLEGDYTDTLLRLRERAQVLSKGEVRIRAPDLIEREEAAPPPE